MNDLITITSGVLPESTRVVAFRGVEAISRPYEIEIFLSLAGDEGHDFDLADAISAKATLTFDRTDDALPPFLFTGILASMDLLHAAEGRSLVRAVLVPRLWLLSLSRHSRIFTKKTLPEIIEAIMDDNGLSGSDYEMRLASYEPEEHVCQYRESDLDFISRWMEREGIYYYFEHGDDGEKVIFADGSAYADDLLGKPVRYFPQLGQDRSAGASFRAFVARHRTLPASIKLKDYDYLRPNLSITGSAQVSATGAGEVSLYGERFFSPAAGARLANLRAEELLARQVVYEAKGTRSHLRTGHTFELEEHPREPLNTKYLAIEIRHHGNQAGGFTHFDGLVAIDHDEVYLAEVFATPASTQFRAESRTPWPRIYGYENGVVDGPATSEYAQIDNHGRYAVKFTFDESSLKDGKASTYVRMMQPHGGGIEGFHFPLRKGTEVVLSFLGGDPDRPVISGVVPTALTPSPVTSGNHTTNVIQTGGRNRLELEDKTGQQRVTLSTPYSNSYVRMGSPNEDHELIVKTDDNTLLDAGKNYDQTVGQNGGGSWTATIKDNWVTHVQAGKHELFVDAGTSLTDVKGNTRLHVVSGNNTIDVDAGAMTTTVKADTVTHVVSGKYEVDVDAGNTTIDTKAGTTDIKSKGKLTLHTDDQCAIEVASNLTLKVGGDVSKNVVGSETLQTFGAFKKLYASNNVNVTGGMKSDTFLGLSNSNAVGASIGTFIGAKVTLEASGALSATYAYKLDISGGASLAFKYGMSMTVDNVIALTLKPTEVKAVSGPLLKRVGFQLACLSMYLASSGAYVIS